MSINSSPSFHDSSPQSQPFAPDRTPRRKKLGKGKKLGMWTGGLLAALVILGAVGPKQPVTPTGAAPLAATSSPTTTEPQSDAEDTAAADAAAAKKAAADRVAADEAATAKAAAAKAAAAKATAAKATAAKAAIDRAAAAKRAATFVVIDVVDGDTVRLANGEKVRVVGIDTPEQGECNYETATRKMEALVLGKSVTLAESDEDRDRYGRLLRYLDVGDRDAGLEMIKAGLAIARYDSRDGYGAHPREDSYITADAATPNRTCASPPPASPPPASEPAPANNCMAGYSPCLPIARDLDCADIDGPVRVTGSDPYRLDRDGDGTGCDA